MYLYLALQTERLKRKKTAEPENFNQQYLQFLQQTIDLQRENNEFCTGNYKELALKKHERPIIEQNTTDSKWGHFLDSWNWYKQMINPRKIRNELRMAYYPEINQLLFKLISPDLLNTLTEQQLLQQIWMIAVKSLHVQVHQQSFQNMKHTQSESITHFLAKLQLQAKLYGFMINGQTRIVVSK